MGKHYIVASCKPWHRARFQTVRSTSPESWTYVETPKELEAAVHSTLPRYIFFLHWNWLVPQKLWAKYECVCFHMTDVPYGRGGSPLQNLIELGHTNTRVAALRMVEEMDAGPVYAKREMSLDGRAEDIYLRAGGLCWEMIDWLIHTEPRPIEQSGEVTRFSRRKPEQSKLPDGGDLRRVYDHIRMLDAPTYPLAFVEHGEFVLEFSHASLSTDEVKASVIIRKKRLSEN